MACPRVERERLEHYIVGPYGVLSENSKGRLTPEEECDVRCCFQRDVDRITHSKSARVSVSRSNSASATATSLSI